MKGFLALNRLAAHAALVAGGNSERLRNAPLGTKAPAIGGGHWVKVDAGWRWFNGSTFPTPGGDWNGKLIYPTPEGQGDE